MSLGMGELVLILVIVFVLFGAGKLPQVMGDIGKGVKSLKKGLKEEEKQSLENSQEEKKN
jgi:sec-independent protein translocase protein TatA